MNRPSSDPDSILPEDAPPGEVAEQQTEGVIAVLSRDLFFGMRIRTALKHMNHEMALAKDEANFVRVMQDEARIPVLGLVDFNQPVKWDVLKSVLASDLPVIAFGSHTDIEGFRLAKAAGVTRVTSNGDFSRSLPDLIAKYRLMKFDVQNGRS